MVGSGNQGKLRTEGRPGLAGLTGVRGLAQKFGAIVGRRAIGDRAMRADGVVIVAEGPPDALGLEDVGKELSVQALVTEATVEALVHSILPGTAGLDEAGVDLRLGEPFTQTAGNKLPAVVAAHVTRCSVTRHGRLQGRHDLAAAHPTAGYDIEAVVAVFVQECQELHRGAVLGGVEDHVYAPDVVDAVRFDLRIRARRTFRPHGRAEDLQALTAPDALDGPQSASQPLPGQDSVDPPIAVPWMGMRQRQDLLLQLCLPGSGL